MTKVFVLRYKSALLPKGLDSIRHVEILRNNTTFVKMTEDSVETCI